MSYLLRIRIIFRMPVRKCGFVLLSLIAFNLLHAQKIDTVFFQQKEQELIALYNKIKSSAPDQQAKSEKEFECGLFELLKDENSFYYSFPELKFIGRIQSSDGFLNTFTWNIPLTGGFNNYYCILQYLPKKADAPFVFKLKELPAILNKNRQAPAETESWIGALYYQVVANKYKGTVYYTLMGFHFNNIVSNIKTVEVLAFDDQNFPYFPQRKFLYQGKPQNRIVFEYNERVQMTLEYNQTMEKIVFDHLSPNRPSLEGQFQFYGPDMSYDALFWQDGIWVHESDIPIEY